MSRLVPLYSLTEGSTIFRLLLLLLIITSLYSNDYLTLAKEKKLSESRYWHILLHMPDNVSEIDDENFFLSPEGKFNADAELQATIKALVNEKTLDDNATGCRFPARRFWLEKELKMRDLPILECKEFNTLMKRVDPQSVSLIFPAGFIESPASMFGHTFLRIDSKYKSKMLSYAINYAADANNKTESGLVFAVKGLFGGYYGKYSLLPYYDKIKEYRDSEERDMWEYDLDLSPTELQQMLRHIWEIHDTYSWYYFFTENCSYNMLWLIEVARESIHTREYFNYQVIPPETIHAIVQEGIVTKRHYRPARRSKLLAYEKYLKENEVNDVFNLARNELSIKEYLENNASKQTKQYVLEASSEFIEYDFLAGKINQKLYRDRLHAILGARSSLGKGEEINIPQPDDPMQGHRATRVRFEGGVRNGEGIGFLGVRPANHDIKDSDVGFLRGTQIEFLDFLFSYGKEDDFNVEKATLISIVSLSPRGKFFQPFSWRLHTGWDREYLSDSTKFISNASGGFTWGNDLGYVYILADALFYTDRDLTLGLGGVTGFVLYEGRDFKTNFEATERIYDTGSDQTLFSASQHYRSSQNTALSLSYEYVEKYESNWNTVKFTFDYFF